MTVLMYFLALQPWTSAFSVRGFYRILLWQVYEMGDLRTQILSLFQAIDWPV